MSYEEEDTCMSYEEEDTCMSYEEEDTWSTSAERPLDVAVTHLSSRAVQCAQCQKRPNI